MREVVFDVRTGAGMFGIGSSCGQLPIEVNVVEVRQQDFQFGPAIVAGRLQNDVCALALELRKEGLQERRLQNRFAAR